MRRSVVMAKWLLAATGAVVTVAPPAPAQTPPPLDTVIARARSAWLAHDTRALMAASDTVRLRIPGVAASAAARAGQAARLLSEHFDAATELAFELRELRYVDTDHAYAEFIRRYAVRGTTAALQETVFLGFRQVEGRWRLREVRIAP
jgi:hypothetical protein